MVPGPSRAPQVVRADDPGSPTADPAGTLSGRRAPRPGLRAVAGGLLVAAAAVIVFAASLSAAGGNRLSYVVAERDLPAGAVISPGDVGLTPMALDGATRAASFRSPDALVGHVLAVAVGPGQLVESSMLADRPGATRPVSVAVDPTSMAALAPGDPVDVLETPAAGTGGGGAGPSGGAGGPTVVLRNAVLVSVGGPPSGLLGGAGTSGTVVTLGVGSLTEAEALIAAAHNGTIDLIRAYPSDGRGSGP